MAADHVIENDLLNDTTGNYCSDFVHKLKSYIFIELSYHSILEAKKRLQKRRTRPLLMKNLISYIKVERN